MRNGWKWVTERALPSDLQAGHDFIADVLVQLEQQDWPPREVFGVHLALEEAVVNAIKRGNRQSRDKFVQVACKISPDRCWISVTDEGEGFNPGDVPDCTDDEHLTMPNGRGLLLMRCYMSRVEFSPKGNAVTMEKERLR